ncbi:MAG: hypothetical protein HFJ75_07625 [Eggerthellaceae bacterium]|nr:hypothetical protein [Eggerthellaceae bacterium]
MDNEKTLAERIREITDHYACAPTAIASAVTGKNINAWCVSSRKCEGCKVNFYNLLADAIEREVDAVVEAQGRGLECSAHHVMRTWADRKGVPWGKGESITEWLSRNFLPRPRFEDGTPVKLGDMAAGKIGSFEINGIEWAGSKEDYAIWKLWDGEDIEHAAMQGGPRTRVKRIPDPEPDTQERIDEDAMKSTSGYWGCCKEPCSRCPALIDGNKPSKHYGVQGCYEARSLDLLRRQRELDAKTMGGAA